MELSRHDIQDIIISLEKDLFSLQREAEMYGVLDYRLVNVKAALDKMRKRLGEHDAICD